MLAAGAGGDKQAERVRSMFQRQLLVPLAGGEATLAAYTAWEQQQISADAKVSASQPGVSFGHLGCRCRRSLVYKGSRTCALKPLHSAATAAELCRAACLSGWHTRTLMPL